MDLANHPGALFGDFACRTGLPRICLLWICLLWICLLWICLLWICLLRICLLWAWSRWNSAVGLGATPGGITYRLFVEEHALRLLGGVAGVAVSAQQLLDVALSILNAIGEQQIFELGGDHR